MKTKTKGRGAKKDGNNRANVGTRQVEDAADLDTRHSKIFKRLWNVEQVLHHIGQALKGLHKLGDDLG